MIVSIDVFFFRQYFGDWNYSSREMKSVPDCGIVSNKSHIGIIFMFECRVIVCGADACIKLLYLPSVIDFTVNPVLGPECIINLFSSVFMHQV